MGDAHHEWTDIHSALFQHYKYSYQTDMPGRGGLQKLLACQSDSRRESTWERTEVEYVCMCMFGL